MLKRHLSRALALATYAATLAVIATAAPPIGDDAVAPFADGETVVLTNELLRIEFRSDADGAQPGVRTAVLLRCGGDWRPAQTTPEAEQYVVTAHAAGVSLKRNVGHKYFNATQHAQWNLPGQQRPCVSIFETGQTRVFYPRSVRIEESAAMLEFHPEDLGQLEARWSLATDAQTPKVTLSFVPREAGSYSLGYRVFWAGEMHAVAELLHPALYVRRGLPETPVTLTDPYMSTPLALVQTRGSSAWTVGVAGDPSEIPHQWPDGWQPHFGMMLRRGDGRLQPSIAGPVPGTPAAKAAAGERLSLTFRVLATAGDWYAGYRAVADDVFGWADYRRNWNVSLTDAVYNMIDLLKDDTFCGWWPEAKGFYQIESQNSASQSAPAVLLSVYRLTGDEDLRRRRALPTLEYCLSRRNYHFAPAQRNQKAGSYVRRGDNEVDTAMQGPIRGFGPPTYGALWELCNRRTRAFGDLALRGASTVNDVRTTWNARNAKKDADWFQQADGAALALELDALAEQYVLTDDPATLERAQRVADAYIERAVATAPTKPQPGFWHRKLPHWQGLLRLYELTGESRYLEAARFGGRQLMTGIWTQPRPPANETVWAQTEQYREFHDALWLWRGDRRYRRGYRSIAVNTGHQTGNLPNPPERSEVPAWLVSNVGLAFEAVQSYNDPRAPLGRFIYQNVWTPDFLRLAQHTEDAIFETYARNAVIGRFANYPGYYVHGRISAPLDPRYPYEHPDLTYSYYHHIPVHLGWCIDYLVADAERHASGRIRFPALRQTGYVFFDFRVYGHRPGRIFDRDNVWLWLQRDVVQLDQPQFNYLVAHDEQRLFVLVMNQDRQARKGVLQADAALLGASELTGKRVAVLDAAGDLAAETRCTAERVAEVSVPPRDMRVVVLHDVKPSVDAHRVMHPQQTGSGVTPVQLGWADRTDAPFAAYGVPLQIEPGRWRGFVWLDAGCEQVRSATLRYSVDGGQTLRTQTCDAYPYEFSVDVDPEARLEFELNGRDWDCRTFESAQRYTLIPAH